jgi:hypothetical protein
MITINESQIQRLVQIESQIQYSIPPDPPRHPFVVIERESPVLLSAPHGAICLRNNQKELWHEEDEYTAGMALLLGELCNTSVIATTWKTIDSDPNYHFEEESPYKRKIRRLVKDNKIKWVIDLHGAGSASTTLKPKKLIDIGTRKELKSFNPKAVQFLKEKISEKLGDKNFINENAFPAYCTKTKMSVTAFCHKILYVEAMQLEMKPEVRIPVRRIDSSAYLKGEHIEPEKEKIIALLQSIAEFINYLHVNVDAHKNKK